MSSVYSCKGKGGRYVVIGHATPAGRSREAGQPVIIVYRDLDSGLHFYREEWDFSERMELIGHQGDSDAQA